MKTQMKIIILSSLALAIGQMQFAATGPVQTPGLQFIPATTQNIPFCSRVQPNIGGWVGPTQYIEATNQNIRSFNKVTSSADGLLDMDSASLIGAPISDSQLIFDRWGQRWIVIGAVNNFATASTPAVAITYSDGPIISASTQWTVQVITDIELIGAAGSVKSPKLASDQNAVYINCNMYNLSGSTYLGVTPVVIPQTSFVAGNPFLYTALALQFTPTEYPTTGFKHAPSPNNFDASPEFGYIVVSPASETAGVSTYTHYNLLRIINPGSASPTLYPAYPTAPISLTAPIFTDGTHIPHLGNLYGTNGLLQNSNSNSLNTGGCHIRNHQLYFVTTGLVNDTGTGTLAGDRNAILWYQYDLTGGGTETESTIPTLVQSGAIYDPTVTDTPVNYWNPAIMTDVNNNIVITGNFAGADSYIQAFYVGRLATDTAGHLRDIVILAPNNIPNTSPYNLGTLVYNNANGQRWGDYCSIAPDPTDDVAIWATNQIVTEQNLWGLLTTQLLPS